MMSLPVWLTGPMFLVWGEESLSRGVSIQEDPPLLYGDNQAVRILLECFLVSLSFYPYDNRVFPL